MAEKKKKVKKNTLLTALEKLKRTPSKGKSPKRKSALGKGLQIKESDGLVREAFTKDQANGRDTATPKSALSSVVRAMSAVDIAAKGKKPVVEKKVGQKKKTKKVAINNSKRRKKKSALSK